MQKNPKLKEKAVASKELSFFDLANVLLANLQQRSQEILKKRFGLMSGEVETLEKIGKDYGITRERVRQIITDAVNRVHLLAETEAFKRAENRIVLEISKNSGIISEEDLIENLSGGDRMESNAIIFFAFCSKQAVEIEERGLTKKAWAASKEILEKVKKIEAAAKDILTEAGIPLPGADLVEKIVAKGKEFSKNETASLLRVLTGVSKNKFGKWGFSSWMEINPKGTRERIYLVLKEGKKPLHFREIAKSIDETGINKKKKSHPQTVHNELIKDDRFVLIGRGIYALKEWGYVPGTIKDVIEGILKESGKPMTKEEIVESVLKTRKVKKATIMINLNNKNRFMRVDGKYALKQ